MDTARFESEVISLTDLGPIAEKIHSVNIPVRALGMRRGLPNPIHLFRLAGWLRATAPNLVQTWMSHADVLGGMAARMAGNIPVVWGIRHTPLLAQNNKRTTIWTAKLAARLSNTLPQKIVCCAEAIHKGHVDLGYRADKMVVIPNGFDLETLNKKPSARTSLKKELNIPKEGIIIGLIGRFDPNKDHHNFIKATGMFGDQVKNVHYVLCGDGIDAGNKRLANWIADAQPTGPYHLLGRRDDMPRIYSALDIACSSSSSEGFPNVVGEAMACAVPVVATDVGDAALMIGDTGRVVPANNAAALARGLLDIINAGPQERTRLGEAARKRIESRYALPVIRDQYESLYEEVAAQCAE